MRFSFQRRMGRPGSALVTSHVFKPADAAKSTILRPLAMRASRIFRPGVNPSSASTSMLMDLACHTETEGVGGV